MQKSVTETGEHKNLSLLQDQLDDLLVGEEESLSIDEDQIITEITWTKDETDDRRSSPRIQIEAKVDFEQNTDTGNTLFTGKSYDISSGGIFIVTNIEFSIGEMIDMNLSFPKKEEIQVQGKVCWQRSVEVSSQGKPAGIGVEFIDLAENANKILNEVFQENQKHFQLSKKSPPKAKNKSKKQRKRNRTRRKRK